MRTAFAFVLASFLMVSPVWAKFMTAEMLVSYLESGECVKDSIARGYIIGVYDSFEGTLYAQHKNLSEDELIAIVMNYIRTRPKSVDYSAQYVIMRSLEVHFREQEGDFFKK